MTKNTTIAVDLAKSVFEIAVSDRPGRVTARHRLSREAFLRFFAERQPAVVLMEACGSAHHWGRELQALRQGFGCSLRTGPDRMSPATRPIAPTPKGCSRPIATNRSKPFRSSRSTSRRSRRCTGFDRHGSPPVRHGSTPFAVCSANSESSSRWAPSESFRSSKSSTSGLRRRLGAIGKRGDVYIRMLLSHGARAVLWKAMSRKAPDRLRAWALRLEQQRGHNKAAIALANKLARIVWAVWRRDVEFTEKVQQAA